MGLKKSHIVAIALSALFAMPTFASATVLVEQPISSHDEWTQNAPNGTVTVVAAHSGVPLAMEVWYQATTTINGDFQFYLQYVSGGRTKWILPNSSFVISSTSALWAPDEPRVFSMADCVTYDVASSTISAGCSITAGTSYYYQQGFSTNIHAVHIHGEANSPVIHPYFSMTTDYTPRVSILTPTAQTYVGNPVTFSGLFTNTGTYNQIQFHLVNTTVGINVATPAYALPAQTLVGESWSVDKYLPFQGNYELKARLYNSFTGDATAYTPTVTFGLGTTTTVSTTTQSNTQGSVTPLDCSTFDIGCYIKNAFVWLFYPTTGISEEFSQISLEHKAPFAYMYDFGNVIDEMYASASSSPSAIAVTIPWVNNSSTTITFLSKPMIEAVPFQPWIKLVITFATYIMTGSGIYYYVLRAHNTA